MGAKAAVRKAIRVALRGDAILTHPRFNKGAGRLTGSVCSCSRLILSAGTAFTIPERKAFGLTGRLPYRVNSLEEQCRRAYDQLRARDTPIRKNTFLQVWHPAAHHDENHWLIPSLHRV